jgi:hypothetical protein
MKKKKGFPFLEGEKSKPETSPAEEEVNSLEEPESDEEDVAKRMEKDIALFHSLFPEVKAEEIPLSVWQRVEMGESLAASYALYAVAKMREEEAIRAVNEANEKKALPPIRRDGTEAEYFSPEAVKSMSRSEIKKHYDAILRSMEQWN